MPSLTDRELVRDQRVFRSLKQHHMTEHEKLELLALGKTDYRVYQQALLELAKRYRVQVPEV